MPIRKSVSGEVIDDLKGKVDVFKTMDTSMPGGDSVYLGELGFKEKSPHPIYPDEKTRTLMGKDVRDEVPTTHLLSSVAI